MSDRLEKKLTVVILAAGYGTRLQKDVCADTSGRYEHLQHVAKPLFPVAGRPLIDHWICQLQALRAVRCCLVVVVVNAAHREQFTRWRQTHADSAPPVQLVVDETSTDNPNRSGAVACMSLAVGGVGDSDFLFIGGDTLFDKSFSLEDFLVQARDRIRQEEAPSLHVTAVPCAEHMVHKHGIIEIGDGGRVVNFKEKPSASETKSRVQCPCFYLMSASGVAVMDQYLAQHTSLQQRDAAGFLVAHFVRHCAVFAYPAQRRYDIGSLESYLECCRDFEQ